MTERRLRALLFLLAIALCAWGCKLPKINLPEPPVQPPVVEPAQPEPTCTPNPCPSDRPQCMVITVDGTPTGRKVIACTAPVVEPTPEPKPACDLREADLEPAPVQREATLTSQVIAAQRKLGPRPGSDPHVSLALLAAELRAAGYCSIAGQEAIFTRAADGLIEEHHAVFFGNGDWITNGKYVGVHRLLPPGPGPVTPGGVSQAPAPGNSSMVSNSCGDPLPPGVGRVKVVEHIRGPNRTVVDATVMVHDWAYCRAVGFTDGRLYCAFRQEGAPDRVACEALYPLTWTGPGWADESNPALWIVPRGAGGTVTACAGGECGSVEVQP